MQSASDPFDLQRFLRHRPGCTRISSTSCGPRPQAQPLDVVCLSQIAGLGSSATAVHYAISSLDEARAYLRHHVLGPRLRECAQLVHAIWSRSIRQIFGSPDAMLVRSSMTLFAHATHDNGDFVEVLARHYDGDEDPPTVAWLR